MIIEPISKSIFDKAKKFGVTEIVLNFSGGSDEGYLEVLTSPSAVLAGNQFDEEIEEWAWEAYSYGGAGDGSQYGDNITYNLNEGTVEHSSWYHVIQDGESSSGPLVVDK